jgi:hypothetical protein
MQVSRDKTLALYIIGGTHIPTTDALAENCSAQVLSDGHYRYEDVATERRFPGDMAHRK